MEAGICDDAAVGAGTQNRHGDEADVFSFRQLSDSNGEAASVHCADADFQKRQTGPKHGDRRKRLPAIIGGARL